MTALAFLIPVLLFVAYRTCLRMEGQMVRDIERDPETRMRRELEKR